MLNRFFHFSLNPFFQALLVAGLIIVFLPLGLKKYSARQVQMTTNFDQSQYIFSDLDHDGYSEKIMTFFNLSGNVGIALVDGVNTLGQWNFRGIYTPNNPRIMTGNFDHDENDEIYIFTLVNDSVMLHALEFSREPEHFIQDRFIAQLGKTPKDPDYLFLKGDVVDMTGEGYGDLVFSINGGHSRSPRKVFIYDILNDTLHLSPESGAFISRMKLENLDDDLFPEIILSTYAASNYNDEPVEFSDTSSWLMILDHDLDFFFPPVEFPGPTGGTEIIPYEIYPGKKGLFYFATYGSPLTDKRNWSIADIYGNVVRERTLDLGDPLFTIGLIDKPVKYPENKVLGVLEHDGFYEIDTNLDCRKVSNANFSRWTPDFLDIDLDGVDEIILLEPGHERHLIYRSDFTESVALDFPIQPYPLVLSIKLNGNKPPQLSVQGEKDWKLYDYGINPAYRYRFMVWLGIYLAVLGFILIIRKLYSIQLKKRYETEKKITRLQLSSIKAQMEPHFIMNTINTIGSSIYRQKPDEAYQLLLNFSGMVRSLLVSSDKLTRTLREELDFVRNYLDLEKNRFGEVFTYSIHEEEGINPDWTIPKMIIQLHCENALKHGLIPKRSGGMLDIELSRNEEYLCISVRDNGIGRSAALKSRSSSTGKGMKIIEQLFETYNKHNHKPLQQEITDLYDERGKPAGTLVKILVPVDFNEGIF